MVGRLHNKARKQREFEREAQAKVRPVDMSLIAKSCLHYWQHDGPVGDTRMIKCFCGHKRRFHIALGTRTFFRCSKCGARQELKS
jgi:hypothetical protein